MKLWAIEGIKKIKEYGGPIWVPTAEAKAAKVITDFLDNPKVPAACHGPSSFAASKRLRYLRQGFLPTQPDKPHMATTAMRFLADQDAKLEVRAEAARGSD